MTVGPNGADKTTTMRVILGLDAPTSGHTTINSQRYTGLVRPLHQVGALPRRLPCPTRP